MATSEEVVFDNRSPDSLPARFQRVRSATLNLCSSLKPEDFVIQSIPDVSPAKWHLAHVSWFFEHFILEAHSPHYKVFREEFNFLFNSYYYTVGPMHRRPERGMLSRPSLDTVISYREHVDAAMLELLAQERGDDVIEQLVTVGLNHEQQHQELLLTDIKHVFSRNPTQPAVDPAIAAQEKRPLVEHRFIRGADGRPACSE